jgi:microcystin synthetase protein McyC
MAVGLLGILKAGGTCLPLDATSSSERLQYLLEDAQPRVLLTMRHVRDHLPEGGIPMLFLDADWEMIALQSRTNFRSPVIAANVACILYSSGSTRRPEGVMVSHYAITQRLWWVQSETPLTPADSVLPLASFWELFGSWLAGARVVLVDPARQFDSTYLIQFMARQRITVAHFVPSLLQRVVATPGLETCRDLRWIFCRGEVPVHLPQQLLSRLRVRFYQFYGPAEAAMRAAYWI